MRELSPASFPCSLAQERITKDQTRPEVRFYRSLPVCSPLDAVVLQKQALELNLPTKDMYGNYYGNPFFETKDWKYFDQTLTVCFSACYTCLDLRLCSRNQKAIIKEKVYLLVHIAVRKKDMDFKVWWWNTKNKK